MILFKIFAYKRKISFYNVYVICILNYIKKIFDGLGKKATAHYLFWYLFLNLLSFCLFKALSLILFNILQGAWFIWWQQLCSLVYVVITSLLFDSSDDDHCVALLH